MKYRWLIWIPRALIIIFALFTMIFSFDVFGTKAPWYDILAGFLIHNIPFFVLMVVLLFTWNRPMFGSVIFTMLTVAFTFLVRINGHIGVLLIFTLPPLLIAFLFFIVYVRNNKEIQSNTTGHREYIDTD